LEELYTTLLASWKSDKEFSLEDRWFESKFW
jgi:hypothetical protein